MLGGERATRARLIVSKSMLALCATLVGVLGQAGIATAAGSFGREGGEAGEFSQPSGAAVNRESGVLYVADRNNQRIDAFSEAGDFLLAWGWGVGDGHTEALQTCTSTCFAGRLGEGSGQFAFPEGIAVDNDPLSSSLGDVYVVDTRNHRVQKFSPSGAFELMFGRNVHAGGGDVCRVGESCTAGEAGEGPGQFEGRAGVIATTSTGSVVVGDVERLEVFDSEGMLEREVSLPGAGKVAALAVDEAGNFYVVAEGFPGVHEFTTLGAEVGEPRDAGGVPGAITTGPAGELFVVDSAEGIHHVLEYAPGGEQVASFDRNENTSGENAGIVLDKSQSALYILNSNEARIVSPPAPGPLVVDGSDTATEISRTSAGVSAIANAEGTNGTSSFFEYGPSTGYGKSTSQQPMTGAAFEDQRLTASLTGLLPSTEYHYRLVVVGEKGETLAVGGDGTFVTQPPVIVERVFATELTDESVRLSATVNPLGSQTTYRFEYGTSPYEVSTPQPAGELPAGQTSPVEIAVTVGHLTPGATYHFRVVTQNALGEVTSPDHTVTTQSTSTKGLLDSRQWEMVSPPHKEGVSLEGIPPEGGLIQAADTGSAITYFSLAPVEQDVEGNRALANSQVVATRSSSGWTSKDISVKHEKVTPLFPGNYSEYRMFSEDLTVSAVEPEGTTPLTAGVTERTPYERRSSGELVPYATPANVRPGIKFGGVETLPGQFNGGVNFVTATPDMTSAVLVSPQALTTELETGPELPSVYVWHDGKFRLASIMPDGRAAADEGLPAVAGRQNNNVRGAISDDGSRVVFAVASGGGEQLYLRDMSRDETVQLDAPEPGSAAQEANSNMQFASSDGRRVFFLDTNRLTRDSTAREAKPDLYMCEVEVTAEHLRCRIEDLTVASASEAANVQGAVIGADRSGEDVYFVANARMAPGAISGDCNTISFTVLPPPEVSCNLYVREVDAHRTRLVSVVAGRDQNDWAAITGFDFGGTTARVSDNGRFLVFMSQRSLTGFDNRDAQSGEPDEEVFLFDRETGALTCISCSRSNAAPDGIFEEEVFAPLLVDRPGLWATQWLAASIPGWTKVDALHSLYASRVVSNTGRVFFNSATPLVPQDTNGKEDVYEYEPNGEGSCREQSGCVGLVSSGVSGEESAFLDANENGDDVFFITAARLTSADHDAAFDIYDAHACTADVPCLAPPVETSEPCSSSGGCRVIAPVPMATPSFATETPSGTPPSKPAPAVVRPKPLTRAEKLARALRACKKVKAKKKRAACVRSARRRYGAKPKKKGRGHR
ncbi:MAG TPA: hypothetical protein VMB05_11380 [Solirubrobacteraceae bacterium]|nr:hypothetical protein [Solirubrobacteraceae bacterium]